MVSKVIFMPMPRVTGPLPLWLEIGLGAMLAVLCLLLIWFAAYKLFIEK